MSKKCELTGKSPLKGHKVSHANNKAKRKFLPNLGSIDISPVVLILLIYFVRDLVSDILSYL